MMDGYGMGFFPFGMLLNLVFIIAAFFLIWWFIKGGMSQMNVAPDEKPLDILKKRLARGEISKSEYQDLKKEL